MFHDGVLRQVPCFLTDTMAAVIAAMRIPQSVAGCAVCNMSRHCSCCAADMRHCMPQALFDCIPYAPGKDSQECSCRNESTTARPMHMIAWWVACTTSCTCRHRPRLPIADTLYVGFVHPPRYAANTDTDLLVVVPHGFPHRVAVCVGSFVVLTAHVCDAIRIHNLLIIVIDLQS